MLTTLHLTISLFIFRRLIDTQFTYQLIFNYYFLRTYKVTFLINKWYFNNLYACSLHNTLKNRINNGEKCSKLHKLFYNILLR